MKKLLLLLIVAGVLWAIWSEAPVFSFMSWQSAPVAEQTNAIAPAPAAAGGISLPARSVPQQPLQVAPDDLVIIRGTVVGYHDGMPVISCRDDRNVGQGFAWNVDAGSGAAASEQLAKMAIGYRNEKIAKEFGTLQRIPPGYSRELSEQSDRVIGRLVLHGYSAKGDKVHIVAADTGATFEGLPLFTLNYNVRSKNSAQASAAVTWSAFPPGVDTPEQRRAYLQQLAEAKRQREAEGKR